MASKAWWTVRDSLALGVVVLALGLLVAACSSSGGNARTGGTRTSRPASAPGAVSTSSTLPIAVSGLDKIEHFVFIMQENRSFDSYFGTYPGADGIPSGGHGSRPVGWSRGRPLP